MDDEKVWNELVNRVARNVYDYEREIDMTLETMDSAHLLNLDQCGDESLIDMLHEEADIYAEDMGMEDGYSLLEELGKSYEDLFFDAIND